MICFKIKLTWSILFLTVDNFFVLKTLLFILSYFTYIGHLWMTMNFYIRYGEFAWLRFTFGIKYVMDSMDLWDMVIQSSNIWLIHIYDISLASTDMYMCYPRQVAKSVRYRRYDCKGNGSVVWGVPGQLSMYSWSIYLFCNADDDMTFVLLTMLQLTVREDVNRSAYWDKTLYESYST